MDRTPAYRVQVETRPPNQSAGMERTWFQGRGQGEVEEDLAKVRDIWSAIIAEDQDIMLTIVLTQHVCRVSISLCMMMKRKTILCW